MKTLVLFREGLSGHYLKSLIDDSNKEMSFRVDHWQPGIYDVPRTNTEEDCKCLHTHRINFKNFPLTNYLCLTIQVREKIYTATYNNFYKKFLIENPQLQDDFKNWQSNAVNWYDRCYYNLKEYYQLYQEDLVNNNNPNIVEFDNILDLDYIESVFRKYFNRHLTDNMRRIVTTYKQLQLQYDLPKHESNMKDIVSSLPDTIFQESPWFASYCIFKYENNNNLQESQREWSIDQIQRPIDKQFLISIADRYQF
jgi:hypothetical protein